MNKTTVLIVDDHAILRMGLASLLGTKPDLTVIGEAEDGPSAIRLVNKLNPDVILMDLVMPGMDGVDTISKIIKAHPKSKILLLTTFSLSDGIASALSKGAKGAIMKSAPLTELVAAIRNIASGLQYISPEIERILSDDPPVEPLSPRQAEILESMARGLSNNDIAKQLGISVDMVREHATSLFVKIKAANRTEAVAIALRKHLLKI